jgi:hypothetical protein
MFKLELLAPWRLFHQISVHAAKGNRETEKYREILVFIPLRLDCSGGALTVLGVGSPVGWNPRSIWIHWGLLRQRSYNTGVVGGILRHQYMGVRAALPKVMICALTLPVMASLTIIVGEHLRCVAFGPLLTAIPMGIILLMIGSGRFIFRRRDAVTFTQPRTSLRADACCCSAPTISFAYTRSPASVLVDSIVKLCFLAVVERKPRIECFWCDDGTRRLFFLSDCIRPFLRARALAAKP